ncbi:hypothetical protein PBY51_007633 [Eleginops maclovinus]|uniref:Uncharacterized protein n=1 Tax=Eleginops maclovinus TaxID=56733 RepID=A0AAN7X1S4_ELEMC|nr:hypothetical protein PBY51_007633 [Eleginops maclovinus]
MWNVSPLLHKPSHACTQQPLIAPWLWLSSSSSSSSRQTEGGEGRRELAQRETGALISDGLTGCVDRAVAQEEEERCNGRTSRRVKRNNIEEQTARDLEGGMRDQ